MMQRITVEFRQMPDGGDWEVFVEGKLENIPAEVIAEALYTIADHEMRRWDDFTEACRRYRNN